MARPGLAAHIPIRRVLGTLGPVLASVLFLFCAFTSETRADVGIILNDSLDTSVARITGSGHSAIYLSRVCPESPVKLRPCLPGEMGSVISNYTTLGEDQPFQWNAVPLSVYLYGVEDPRFRPVFGSPRIKRALEERYREEYIAAYCTGETCKTSAKSEWREMVGATLERSMYVFVVDTTVEQDSAFIKEFNAAPNVNHFNGFSRNCATFARSIINSFFPHAAHADYLNDFGMTSPKAIARSFTHYGLDHPELNFRVYHFAQLPGTIKRSTDPRDGTEQLYRSKKLFVPMVFFAGHELPMIAGSYLLTGRFDPEHELEEYPASFLPATVEPAGLTKAPMEAPDPSVDEIQQRARILGTSEDWRQYRKDFEAIEEEAVVEEIIPNRGYLRRFAKQMGDAGDPAVGRNGAVWIEIGDTGSARGFGVSANNVLSPDSDSRFAYILMLARTDSILKSSKHGRETMIEFTDDWKLLQGARMKALASFAASSERQQRGEAMLFSEKP